MDAFERPLRELKPDPVTRVLVQTAAASETASRGHGCFRASQAGTPMALRERLDRKGANDDAT